MSVLYMVCVHCYSHKDEPNGVEIKRLNRQLQGISVSLLKINQ